MSHCSFNFHPHIKKEVKKLSFDYIYLYIPLYEMSAYIFCLFCFLEALHIVYTL